jgi:hypothetical protein
MQAVLSKEIAANVAEPLKGNIIKSSDRTILQIMDDFCGTYFRPPRPMPGPHHLGIDLAISVATVANVTARSENFRTELMKVAGLLTQKAYSDTFERTERL